MARQAADDTFLLEMIGHIAYDVWMLNEATDLWVEAYGRRASRPVLSAYVESALIHARNLLDFLYPGDGLRADDVAAKDYRPTVRLPRRKAVLILGETADVVFRQISTSVGHICANRHRAAVDWWLDPLRSDVTCRTLRFVTTLPVEFIDRFRYEFAALDWDLDEEVADLPRREAELEGHSPWERRIADP